MPMNNEMSETIGMEFTPASTIWWMALSHFNFLPRNGATKVQ